MKTLTNKDFDSSFDGTGWRWRLRNDHDVKLDIYLSPSSYNRKIGMWSTTFQIITNKESISIESDFLFNGIPDKILYISNEIHHRTKRNKFLNSILD